MANDHAPVKSPYSATNSDLDIRTKLSRRDSSIPDLMCSTRDKFLQQLHSSQMESIFSILQTVKKYYSRAVDYHAYCLAFRPSRYDTTVSKHINKVVKKASSQTTDYFSDLCDPIALIESLDSFELACDTSNIHEGAAMEVPHFFVIKAFATTRNIRTSAATHITPVAASVSTTEPAMQKKLLQCYLEVANWFLKKIANDLAIAKMDSKIIHYIQPCHTTLVQNADDV